MEDMKRDDFDEILDSALAKYAAEPRTGLEERVLANLRAQPSRALEHSWGRWGAMVGLAALVIIVMAWGWRSSKPSHPIVSNRPSSEPTKESSPQLLSHDNGIQIHRDTSHAVRKMSGHRPQTSSVIAGTPKLDQFPSPQPLTDQEEMMVGYVTRFRHQAVLIARLTNEDLERDRMELIGKPDNAELREPEISPK